MKALTSCALALLLCSSTAVLAAEKEKGGISITFNSDDARTHMGPRHNAHDARAAVTTRHNNAMLLLMHDDVAVQLTDSALAKMNAKEESSFLQDLLASTVKLAAGKSVEFPIANIKSAEVRDGVLVLTSDQGKPVFDNVKVNGDDLTRDLSPADAAKFVEAFRKAKARR